MKEFKKLYNEAMDSEEAIRGHYTRMMATAWMEDIKNYKLGDVVKGKVKALDIDDMGSFKFLDQALINLERHPSKIDGQDVKFGGKYFIVESYLVDEKGDVIAIY